MKKSFIMLIMLSGIVGCARNSSTEIVDNGESKAQTPETDGIGSEIDTQMTAEHLSETLKQLSRGRITKELEEAVASTPIKYTSREDGFTVLIPSAPTVINLEPTNGIQVRAYQAQAHDGLVGYNVFCNIFEKKILSDESIRAYLDSVLQGRLLVVDKGQVIRKTLTEFRGFDAQRFKYTGMTEDVEFVHKGVVFLVDGDSISLTILHPKEIEPEFTFDEFTESFELLPLEPVLSPDYWIDESLGLRFTPPVDMSNLNRERGRNGLIVTFANKAGHSMSVFDVSARYPNYTLADVRRELVGVQRDVDGHYKNEFTMPGSQTPMALLMNYVVNNGRIYLIQGSSPKQTYFRSEQKFKAAMQSLSFDTQTVSLNSLVVTLPQSEFRVTFPRLAKKKVVAAAGFESIAYESEGSESTPYLRAEFMQGIDTTAIANNFRAILENHARLAGLSQSEITETEDHLGKVGTYSGIKKVGDFTIKIYGKMVLGESSAINCMTVEPLEVFPSEDTVNFLASIKRK